LQHLLQPRVLTQAAVAAAVSTLACYPRLMLWIHRPGPIWYLEATLFVCSVVLWSFVFAWHRPYTGRPVFDVKIGLMPFFFATVAGLGTGAVFHFFVDPPLRAKFPDEYPVDLQYWMATVPFALFLNQLLMVFAPFDWSMRLFKNRWVAMILTALFVASIQATKIHSLSAAIPASIAVALLAIRFAGSCLAVAFYMRGGVFLVWWWSFLLECRHLPEFWPRGHA
jgi:hypothetical protein